MKANAPREAIDGQSLPADQLTEGDANGAEKQFQLKGAVLTVAETDGETSIEIAAGLDVRNAPAIAVDADFRLQSGRRQSALCPRQTPAQQSQQKTREF